MKSRGETIGLTDGGGRGAALAHKYSQSPHVKKVIALPGNDLMRLNVPREVVFERIAGKLAAENAHQIAELLHGNITLADVCQDDVVAGGGVNRLRQLGVPTVGPTREAGRAEWDKAWSREFMKRHNIPHPTFNIFHSQEEGIRFLQQQDDQPWAVKAAGLALGKGVIIATNNEEAMQAIQRMSEFGNAGSTYLLEQYLDGEEFSTYAICDGAHYQVLGSAQDHKRLNDGDNGPNTGGMGCSSSPLILTPDMMCQVHDVLRKTFDGMAQEENPYTGVLYLGGMVVNGKVYVIEYNARWGDPEAQVVVPGLQTDLVELGRATIEGRINHLTVETDQKVRVAVALAAQGYPDSPIKGKEITGIHDAHALPDITIYGAGVRKDGERYYSNGGRLLYVVGEGNDVVEARDKAYDAMDRIKVEDGAGHFRKDIGYRDVARLKKHS